MTIDIEDIAKKVAAAKTFVDYAHKDELAAVGEAACYRYRQDITAAPRPLAFARQVCYYACIRHFQSTADTFEGRWQDSVGEIYGETPRLQWLKFTSLTGEFNDE